jgi:hypothetical protein
VVVGSADHHHLDKGQDNHLNIARTVEGMGIEQLNKDRNERAQNSAQGEWRQQDK